MPVSFSEIYGLAIWFLRLNPIAVPACPSELVTASRPSAVIWLRRRYIQQSRYGDLNDETAGSDSSVTFAGQRGIQTVVYA